MYAFLADVTLTIHAVFVLFVVGAQLLILSGWLRRWAWTRNPVFRLAHLGAIGFIVLETWFGVPCPLTLLENRLRLMADTDAYEMSFVGYWLNHLLFYAAPPWLFTIIYTAFSLVVVLTFFVYPPHHDRKRPAV